MDTTLEKEGVLSAFNGILNYLSLKELEDLLTVKIFKLTDEGERISLEDVKKELIISQSKNHSNPEMVEFL